MCVCDRSSLSVPSTLLPAPVPSVYPSVFQSCLQYRIKSSSFTLCHVIAVLLPRESQHVCSGRSLRGFGARTLSCEKKERVDGGKLGEDINIHLPFLWWGEGDYKSLIFVSSPAWTADVVIVAYACVRGEIGVPCVRRYAARLMWIWWCRWGIEWQPVDSGERDGETRLLVQQYVCEQVRERARLLIEEQKERKKTAANEERWYLKRRYSRNENQRQIDFSHVTFLFGKTVPS